jgi:hypothetical protein
MGIEFDKRKRMNKLKNLEELALVFLSIYLFTQLPYAWWVYPLFFFFPDASLAGLLAGKRFGAITYNLIHHKAIAVCAYLLGSLAGVPLLALAGVLLLGHSSLDRVLGFGLMDRDVQVSPQVEEKAIPS